jgi:septum site-determining protein MinC
MEVLTDSEAAALKRPTRRVAFELKGVMTSLAVLRLCSLDLALIERQLRIKIAQLPQFFQNAPVVLDLGAMPNGGAEVPLGKLVALLRGCHLVPVGITNGGDDVSATAVAEGLGVLPLRAPRPQANGAASPPAGPVSAGGPSETVARGDASRGEAPRGNDGKTAARTSEPAGAKIAAHRPPLVVRQPVRGGQVIYAQRSDLVVLAPVNPGAEVIADGHVHIYATLRGRAIAGAQGYTEARIFCQRLEAELVAVAGAYVMADDIPPERRGHSAQIFLDGGECRIAAL